MLSTPKFGAETGRLSECGRGYLRTATGCHQLGAFSRKCACGRNSAPEFAEAEIRSSAGPKFSSSEKHSGALNAE